MRRGGRLHDVVARELRRQKRAGFGKRRHRGAEMDVHRERFSGRPVRQREAMLYKNEAGISVARHA